MSVALVDRSATSPGAAMDAELGASTSGTFPSLGNDRDARRRAEDLRTIIYLMLFRVVLASVLLLGAASLTFNRESADLAGRPYVRVAFGLLVLAFASTIAYAMVVRRVRNLVRFGYLQVGFDLLLIAVLVHVTGGALSAFTFLFMIEVVAVALLPERYGAAYMAVASAVLVLVVSLAGYYRILPTVPGQVIVPWEMSPAELLFRLVLNVAAIAAMGALGLNLSGQTRRAGERLARHQQYAGDLALLHQHTIRCLSSGLVTVTLDGQITSINEAACDILGVVRDEALGLPLWRRIPDLGRVLDEAGPVGSVRRQEIDAVRPDGTVRNLGISATPLSDHTGQIIGRVLHFQDLTDLRRMQVQVERAERLASIGRLAAGIAHEIRNPLASISGSVEILSALPGAEGDAQQLGVIVVREVDRLNRLITDLLDYARPHAEEKEPLDLGDVATEIGKAFEQDPRAAKVGVEIEAHPDAAIDGAAGQIRQVLWNLVRNAAEAMPQGGSIRIRIAREDRAGHDAVTVLAVSDTGVGISRQDLDRIFEPFFSKKAGGTGLGLATVARIVEDHRGTIEVLSEPGRGTTFILRFPHTRLPPRLLTPAPERTPRVA